MHWYSASAWESHVFKHTQDDLLIFPDDLTFVHLPSEAIPSTSCSTSEPLLAKVILERAKAAKQYLEEEAAKSTPPKCHIKQGPVKSSKKQRRVGHSSNLITSPYMSTYSRMYSYP